MTNDEIRMTNVFSHWSSDLGHSLRHSSFVIRHLDFVIRVLVSSFVIGSQGSVEHKSIFCRAIL